MLATCGHLLYKTFLDKRVQAGLFFRVRTSIQRPQ
jgi:hypothetical protein